MTEAKTSKSEKTTVESSWKAESRVEAFRGLARRIASGEQVVPPVLLKGQARCEHVRLTLREDHAARIEQQDAAGRQKFDELAGSLFKFFRGTALLFYRDMVGQDGHMPSVMVLGDVHPSNFGIMPDRNGAPIFGVNDFDETLYLVQVTEAVAPHLPGEALAMWDAELDAAIAARTAEEAQRPPEGWRSSMTSQWSEMRQILARARGDLDLLVALEEAKPPHAQDMLGIAARLLEAGRAAEALDWARRPEGRPGPSVRDPLAPARVALEARILDALGEAAEAQALRWRCFEAHLNADVLREHLKRLPDFEDMEVEERALALAAGHANADAALRFLMGWPRHDLAADLIVARRDHWSGRDWHTLPQVADELRHEHPLASTILYCALLDDILARARSKAYGHGARYLAALTELAPLADPLRPEGLPDHADYVAGLERDHGRKTGFWGRVRQDDGHGDARGRSPTWVRET